MAVVSDMAGLMATLAASRRIGFKDVAYADLVPLMRENGFILNG